MTTNYYQRKGITIAQVCQFCKDCGWKSSDANKFLLAAKMLEIAKSSTYIDDPKPCKVQFILKPICKN